MRSRLPLSFVVLAVLTLVAASSAWANPAEGQRLLDQAEAAIRAGDSTRAVLYLEQAYAADPNPRYIANLGVVYERMGEYAKSAEAFQRYLGSDPAADKRAAAEAALVRLSPEGVLVSSPSGAAVRLDGAEASAGNTPLKLRLIAGAHVLRFTLDDHEPKDTALEVSPGKPFRVDITLTPEPAIPVDQALGYTLLGSGLAAMVGSGVLAYLTTSALDDRDAAGARDTFDAAQDRANLYGASAIALGGVGVVAAGVGIAALLRAPGAEPGAAAVQVMPGPSGLVMLGAF